MLGEADERLRPGYINIEHLGGWCAQAHSTSNLFALRPYPQLGGLCYLLLTRATRHDHRVMQQNSSAKPHPKLDHCTLLQGST